MADASGSPTGLPALPPLIGRGDDLKRVVELLREARLVTIMGPGGAGKTRLSLAVAQELQADFPGGVHVVELAAITDPRHIPGAVTTVFNASSGPSVVDGEALLVLDNCEHLTHASADFVEDLLLRLPHLRVLVTSREPLRLVSEMVWPLEGLPTPDSGATPTSETALSFPAIALFVERARQLDGTFRITDDNAAAICSICRQLDGLPLAIELAAARTTVLEPAQIASRLGQRLDLLVEQRRRKVERHHSLRAVVGWSYDLLTEEERSIVERISVFASDFTLESAADICGAGALDEAQMIDLLGRLLDTSLLKFRKTASGRRYFQLETIRLYGREQLSRAGRWDEFAERHARHYLSFLEREEADIWGPEIETALGRIDVEYQNIRTALNWASGRGEAEIALRLSAALGRYWQVRGTAREGLDWFDRALRWTTGWSLDTRARALDAACRLARDLGEFDRGRAFGHESLDLREAAGDRRGAARALTNLGSVAQFQGDFEEAERCYARSLEIWKSEDDQAWIAIASMALGTMAHHRGDLDRALELCSEGVAMFRQLGDQRGVAAGLNNLANILSDLGDYAAAEAGYLESLRHFASLGFTAEVAACSLNLATVASKRDQTAEVLKRLLDALSLFQTLGDLRGICHCAEMTARIAEDAEKHDIAGELTQLVNALRSGRISGDGDGGGTGDGVADSAHEVASMADRLVQITAERANELLQQQRPRPEVDTGLTGRQREIVQLVAQGMTNRQIADVLSISERTVDTHVEHIKRKLDIHTRTGIAIWASQTGLAKAV